MGVNRALEATHREIDPLVADQAEEMRMEVSQ
jgi:hypothetical protein